LGVVWTDQLVPFHRSVSEVREVPFCDDVADPAAVHALVEVHDTPSRTPPRTELGVGWIDQLVPFQASANAERSPLPSSTSPTAVQAVAEVHDTALRLGHGAPVGLGVDWIDQLVPSQRSANVTDP
jgi:hypothetical protein